MRTPLNIQPMQKHLLYILFLLCLSNTPAWSQIFFAPEQVIAQSETLNPMRVVAADLDGDGFPDVLVASSIDSKISLYKNDGFGNFGAQQIISTLSSGVNAAYAADLDGDGDLDVLSASYNDNKIAWFENEGGGNFGPIQTISTNANGARAVYAYDFDGDGDLDVLSASHNDNKIAWYQNDGSGNFGTQQVITSAAFGAHAAFASDLDNDGDLDVISASFYDNKIAWYQNDGLGNFGIQQVISTDITGAWSVFAADLDGDDDSDVIAASGAGNLIVWYENNGSGIFGLQQIITTEANLARSVFAVDLDGDDDIDVLSASHFENRVAWYENDGSGNFGLQQIISNTALGANCVFADDLDGDGDMDVLTTTTGNHKIAWYENIPFVEAEPTPPIAAFTTLPALSPPADTLFICSGQSVQFFNQSENANAFLWDFDNGTTTNIANPTYTYAQAGTYWVQLVAYHPLPISPDTAALAIVVYPALAPNISCPTTVCLGTSADYTTDADCDTYEWQVSGGNITAGQGTPNITVFWNTPPMGTVSLTAGCGEAYCNLPSVASVPIISPDATISGLTYFCINEVLSYSAPYFGGANYLWSIVPSYSGTILSGQGSPIVVVQWNNIAATLHVNYQHQILECSGEASLMVYPKPAFNIAPPDAVCLNGQSVVSVEVPFPMFWTVTGGVIVSGQNSDAVTIQWNNAGTASVSATPIDPNIFCNSVAQAAVSVLPFPQTPDIVGQTIVCPLQTYSYTVAPVQGNTNYVWTVSGGSLIAGQNSPNVSVQWDESGVYSLSVIGQSLVAPFCPFEPASFSPISLTNSPFAISGNPLVCPQSQYTYLITPTLSDAAYTWDISPPDAGLIVQGQGTPEVQVLWQNPSSFATLSAVYCNETAQLLIDIGSIPQPVISQPDSLCIGSIALLQVADVNSGVSYLSYAWQNVVNELLSTNPTLEVSEEGGYSVLVSNANGCTAQAAHVVYGHTAPVAQILSTTETICVEFPVDLPLVAINGTNYVFQWLLNDTLIEEVGTPYYTHFADTTLQEFHYNVLVTDTTNTCTILSDQFQIVQMSCPLGPGEPTDPTDPPLPPPPFICPPVDGYMVDFILSVDGTNCNTISIDQLSSGDFTSYVIYWGDGFFEPFTGTTSSHTYSPYITNVYMITLVGYFTHPVTGNTCLVSDFEHHSVPLVARFDLAEACLGDEWEFQDRSYYLPSTAINSWVWDFGDGTPPFEGGQTETHLYTEAGTYTPTLTISNGPCAVSAMQTLTIEPYPDAGFTTSGGTCAGSNTLFTPNDFTYSSYLWDFGDGATSEVKSPSFSFPTAGTYTVSLQVSNEQGCSSPLVSQDVVIEEAPEAANITASNTLFCEGENALLSAPNGGASYQWSNGQTSPQITVGNSGLYWVNVMLANGCHYTTPPVAIEVIPAPNAHINPSLPLVHICTGDSLTLQVAGNLGYAYQWSPGNNSTNQLIVSTSGTWQVTVTDNLTGCTASDSIETQVQNPSPAPVINIADAVICEGETTDIAISSFTDPNHQYIWVNGMNGTGITVATSGNYWAYSMDQYGCVSDTSNSVTLNVSPFPDISPFPTGCYAVCHGEILSLPANSAQSFQWYYNGSPIFGATGNEFVPQAVGDYWVQMTNAGNCFSTTDVLQLSFLSDCFPPLPVALIDFYGKVLPNANHLQWTTASETNNAYFTLQASTNGQDFTNISQIPAAGNSSTPRQYEYNDEHPHPITYYRLQQTDFDGTARQAGNVITLTRPNETGIFGITHIVPIPTNGIVNITFTTVNLHAVTLRLYDLTGRQVLTQTEQPKASVHSSVLDLSNLPNGMYLFTLNDGETVVSGKVVKN